MKEVQELMFIVNNEGISCLMYDISCIDDDDPDDTAFFSLKFPVSDGKPIFWSVYYDYENFSIKIYDFKYKTDCTIPSDSNYSEYFSLRFSSSAQKQFLVGYNTSKPVSRTTVTKDVTNMKEEEELEFTLRGNCYTLSFKVARVD